MDAQRHESQQCLHPSAETAAVSIGYVVVARCIYFAMQCVLLWAALLGSHCQAADGAERAQPLHIVVHIDLDPQSTGSGVTLLRRYAQDCRKDPGNLSFHLLQERGRPNHLTLVEAWRGEAGYTSHIESAYTKQFRNKIQPMLGSPFDERAHHEIAP